MTDTEQKALALVNGPVSLTLENIETLIVGVRALAKSRDAAIERDKAFRQEVSDAVVKATHTMAAGKLVAASGILAAFIIPKPDPLVEAVIDVWPASCPEHVNELRKALAKRGLEIREKAGE